MRGRQSLLLIVTAAMVALVGAHSAAACGKRSYAYAGVSGTHAAAGIGAAVSTLSLPRVAEGHVAAFVGVGGPGLGPADPTSGSRSGSAALQAASAASTTRWRGRAARRSTPS